MKKLLAGLVLAAVLPAFAGCAAFQKLEDFSISQTTVDNTMAAYDSVFLAPAKNYADLARSNPCSSGVSNANGVCGQPSIAQKLQAADKVVESALSTIQAQLDACTAAGQTTCTGVSTAYTTLKTAISAAESLAETYGVQ